MRYSIHNMTQLQRQIHSKNLHILREIGLMPQYIDDKESNNKLSKKMLSRIPFSSQHRTYRDYNNDIDKILQFVGSVQEIPSDIEDRVKQTKLEIDKYEE